MAIEPNSTLKICKNVKICAGNQLYFASVTEQINYFNAKTKYTVEKLSYLRQSKNSIKVQIAAGNLQDCNYLCFQNTGYGEKWFYAYITGIQYINDNCTEITYTLDAWQSYYFDVTIGQCFIERQHAEDDTIGANLVNENISPGDYVANAAPVELITDTQQVLFIESTIDLWEYWKNGTIQAPPLTDYGTTANVFSGVATYVCQFSPAGWSELETEFSPVHLVQKMVEGGVSDRIINMWMYPRVALPDELICVSNSYYKESLGYHKLYITAGTSAPIKNLVTLQLPRPTDTLDGYTPKNNKLFTWPFCCLYLTNNSGNSIALNWDLFANPDNLLFNLYGTTTGEAKLRITPYLYGSISADMDAALDSVPYPTVSWINDSYSIWLTQNRNSLNQQFTNLEYQADKSLLSATTSTLMSAGSGNIAGAGAGLINMATAAMDAKNNVDNLLASIEDAKLKPNSAQNIQGTGLNIQNNFGGFRAISKCPTSYNAKTIDDYFTKYGYAQKKISTPNIHARARFTYVKTADAAISGGAPSAAISEMQNLLNAGCTFWADHADGYDLTSANSTL